MTIATVATLSLDVFRELHDEGTISSSISTLKRTLSGYKRPTEETDKLPPSSTATPAPSTISPLSTPSLSIPPFMRTGLGYQAISTFWPRAESDDAPVSTPMRTLSGYERPTSTEELLPPPSIATPSPSTIFPLSTPSPVLPLMRTGLDYAPFPEPHHGGSASSPQAYIAPSSSSQAYIAPSQTTLSLPVPTHHQHERRGSHGHSSAIGSSPNSLIWYTGGASSNTGIGSNFYPPQPGVLPHHGGGYTATTAQPRDLDAAKYDEGHSSGPKSPLYQPASSSSN